MGKKCNGDIIIFEKLGNIKHIPFDVKSTQNIVKLKNRVRSNKLNRTSVGDGNIIIIIDDNVINAIIVGMNRQVLKILCYVV